MGSEPCLLRVESGAGRSRIETRHFAIESRLHWVLDVAFRADQSHYRRGHGARNMAAVRHLGHST